MLEVGKSRVAARIWALGARVAVEGSSKHEFYQIVTGSNFRNPYNTFTGNFFELGHFSKELPTKRELQTVNTFSQLGSERTKINTIQVRITSIKNICNLKFANKIIPLR